MAMATDFSSNHRSPDFGRWTNVVRGGGESESISLDQSPLSSSSSLSSLAAVSVSEALALPSDCTVTKTCACSEDCEANDGNATDPPRKPAWNKPSNGVVEVSPVMGADSWPALSESARASPKLAVDSPLTPTIEGSVPTSQGPVSVPPQRPVTNHGKSNPAIKHPMPARQRSSKRGGGSNTVGGPARGGFFRPPPSPPPSFPAFQIPPNNYRNLIPAIQDPSHGGPLYRNNNWDPRLVAGFVPQTNVAPDHHNFFPRGNFPPHPRGDRHYHNNRGGKRDHERGIYPNARDVHFQQHRPPIRGIARPLPSYPTQFSQPVRLPGNPMAPPEFVYISTLPTEPFRGMPFMTRPPMYIPVADPLSDSLMKQINYYFSDANLIKDSFLRSNMDSQGWVPISLIASFPRVTEMTKNIPLILESLRNSTVVEVQDDRIRKRNDWKRWIPTSRDLGTDLALSSPSESGHNNLVTSFQRIQMDEEGKDQTKMGESVPTDMIPSSKSADHSELKNVEEDNQDVHPGY